MKPFLDVRDDKVEYSIDGTGQQMTAPSAKHLPEHRDRVTMAPAIYVAPADSTAAATRQAPLDTICIVEEVKVDMESPAEIRTILNAGPRPGVLILSGFYLDEMPRLDAEREISPASLREAREADLAMYLMSLANGYSEWGRWRYLVIRPREGEARGAAPVSALTNDRLQQIVSRYCAPLVPCYYREGRVEGERIGMIVINDSPLKPFRFARDVAYETFVAAENRWQRETAYRQGEAWIRDNGGFRLATASEITQIKLDAALVSPHVVDQAPLAPLPGTELRIKIGALTAPSAPMATACPPTAATFVPPASFGQLVQALREERLLVFCGAAGAGKRTLARAVAQALAEQVAALPTHCIHDLDAAQALTLLAASEPCILVVEDAVATLTNAELARWQEAARKSGSYLVLTVHPSAAEVPEAHTALVSFRPDYPYGEEELATLLAQRMNEALPALQARGHFADQNAVSLADQLAGRSLRWIATQLGTPGAVTRFASSAQQSWLGDDQALLRLTSQAADLEGEISQWFESLTEAERYFALTAALLGKLPVAEFWRCYEALVHEAWREREPQLATVPGLNERLARHIGDDNSFTSVQRDIVLRLAQQRFHRALIWALPQLQRWVGEHGDDQTAAWAETRTLLANVVGQLATRDWDAVLPTWQAWAADQHDMVREAASRSIARAATTCPDRAHALLEEWARNKPLEAGWVPPRRAYRVRATAALAAGEMGRQLDVLTLERRVLPLLWMLAHDAEPRVRGAVADAARVIGPLRFADLAGLLGYLAADPSKAVRARVAQALREMARVPTATVVEILNSWLEEEGSASATRHRTALLALMALSQQHESAFTALTSLLQGTETTDRVRTLFTEIAAESSGATQALAPLLTRMADACERSAQEVALDTALKLARIPREREDVQALVASWQLSGSPRLVETAAQWTTEWRRMVAREPALMMPALSETETAAEEVADLAESVDTTGPAQPPRVGPQTAPPATVIQPGPRRWSRQAAMGRGDTGRAALWQRVLRAANALALAALLWIALDRFPYYSREWLPVILVVIAGLTYVQSGLGVAAALIAALPALFYHSPTLAVGVLAFGLVLLVAANFPHSPGEGSGLRLEEGLIIFVFPLLLLTPLTMMLPFILGWILRRRGTFVVFWGILLAILVGLAFGRPVIGSFFATGALTTESAIASREPPAAWKSLGWLARLDLYREGSSGLIALLKGLPSALTTTPFTVAQWILWCVATWLVAWAVEQGRHWSGLTTIALVAVAMIAVYRAVMPDLLEWVLPFRPTGGLTLQIIAGALVVLAAIHGPAWVRASGIFTRSKMTQSMLLWRERLVPTARDLVQRLRQRISSRGQGQV